MRKRSHVSHKRNLIGQQPPVDLRLGDLIGRQYKRNDLIGREYKRNDLIGRQYKRNAISRQEVGKKRVHRDRRWVSFSILKK